MPDRPAVRSSTRHSKRLRQKNGVASPGEVLVSSNNDEDEPGSQTTTIPSSRISSPGAETNVEEGEEEAKRASKKQKLKEETAGAGPSTRRDRVDYALGEDAKSTSFVSRMARRI